MPQSTALLPLTYMKVTALCSPTQQDLSRRYLIYRLIEKTTTHVRNFQRLKAFIGVQALWPTYSRNDLASWLCGHRDGLLRTEWPFCWFRAQVCGPVGVGKIIKSSTTHPINVGEFANCFAPKWFSTDVTLIGPPRQMLLSTWPGLIDSIKSARIHSR